MRLVNWLRHDKVAVARPLLGLTFALLLITAAVVAVTWPQAAYLTTKTGGHTDALFSVWRLAWIADSLISEQLRLFDPPIFYPYKDTLAYSDAILLSGALIAPFRWLGVQAFTVYNAYLLFSFVLSGFAAALVCHRVSGSWAAAAVGGVIFTINPHRMEHFEHLELITSAGIPLAFYCWYLGAARRSSAWFAAVLLCIAVQWYLGMYQGLFLATVLPALWLDWRLLDSKARVAATKGVVIGALLLLAVVAPSVAPYLRARQEVGERSAAAVAEYSATPEDFIAVHPRNWLYGSSLSRFGAPERHFFPGAAAVILALAGFVVAAPRTRLLYAAVAFVAVELTLGSNGVLIPVLREIAPPYRSLRAPARAMVVVFLPIALFASLGVTWLIRVVKAVPGAVIAVVLVTILVIEYRMVPDLWDVPTRPGRMVWTAPANSVFAEYPTARPDRLDQNLDIHYMVGHIGDWTRMLNGYSGHYPGGYIQFLEGAIDFPSTRSVATMSERGATHIVVHQRWLKNEYGPLIVSLLGRPELELVARYHEFDGEVAVFRIATVLGETHRTLGTTGTPEPRSSQYAIA